MLFSVAEFRGRRSGPGAAGADTTGTAVPDALSVVRAGGNDARDANAGTGDSMNSAANIANVITDLSNAGATRFLVPNLVEFPSNTFLAQVNSAVGSALDTLETTLPIQLTRLDVIQRFNDIAFDTAVMGGVYGITELVTPCFDGVATVCPDSDTSVARDGIPHPTTRAHEFIGDLALQRLSVPVPAGLWLMVSGAGVPAGFGHRTRRQTPLNASAQTDDRPGFSRNKPAGFSPPSSP